MTNMLAHRVLAQLGMSYRIPSVVSVAIVLGLVGWILIASRMLLSVLRMRQRDQTVGVMGSSRRCIRSDWVGSGGRTFWRVASIGLDDTASLDKDVLTVVRTVFLYPVRLTHPALVRSANAATKGPGGGTQRSAPRSLLQCQGKSITERSLVTSEKVPFGVARRAECRIKWYSGSSLSGTPNSGGEVDLTCIGVVGCQECKLAFAG